MKGGAPRGKEKPGWDPCCPVNGPGQPGCCGFWRIGRACLGLSLLAEAEAWLGSGGRGFLRLQPEQTPALQDGMSRERDRVCPTSLRDLALGVGQARLGAAAGRGEGNYTSGDLVQVTAPHMSPSQ